MIKLDTKNTWCPGCGNFGVQKALEDAIEKIGVEKTVLVSGIGCHGKMCDYLDVKSVCALHGRAIPVSQGVKIGNSEYNVICSVGDGDTYNEGMEHFVHAAKRNADITLIVHDNRNFALTARQFTATSPRGFVGASTPKGSFEKPLNPLDLAFSCNASFIARGFSSKMDQLTDLIIQGVEHKGFSFIEILQPCVAWFNTFPVYNEKVYQIEGPLSYTEGREKAREWDYESDSPIATGLFYKEEREVEQQNRKEVSVDEILKSKI